MVLRLLVPTNRVLRSNTSGHLRIACAHPLDNDAGPHGVSSLEAVTAEKRAQ
jgi:hypothetical protein